MTHQIIVIQLYLLAYPPPSVPQTVTGGLSDPIRSEFLVIHRVSEVFKAKCFIFCSKFRRKCNFVKCEKLFTRRSLSDFLKSFTCVMKQTEWMCELKPSLHGHVLCGAFFFFVLSDLCRFHFDLHCWISLRITTLLLHFSLWAQLHKNWKADPVSAWDNALIVKSTWLWASALLHLLARGSTFLLNL